MIDNVFADLGIPNPEAYLDKVKLAVEINKIIVERGLKQKDSAELLGIDQARISNLNRGQVSKFSLESLIRFCRKCDLTVIIEARNE